MHRSSKRSIASRYPRAFAAGVAASAALLLAPSAQAQDAELTILPFQHAGLSGPTLIPLPAFDDRAGERTLTGVSLRWEFLGAFQIQLENLLARPARTGGVASLSIAFTDASVNTSPRQYTGDVPDVELAPADAVTGEGPDYINLGRQAWPFEFETSPSDLAPYTRPDPVAAIEFTSYSVAFIDGEALAQTLSFPRAEGNLFVTYTYVPSPAASVALLLLLARRPRRAARNVMAR